MVAAVQGNQLAAVHRTYLKTDGSGKADIEPSKMMLGATKKAAVRLSESAVSYTHLTLPTKA